MRQLHQISFLSFSTVIQQQLEALGFDVGYNLLRVYEDDHRWSSVQRLLVEHPGHSDIPVSYYTHDELLNASFLRMHCSWHYEYPMPDNSFDRSGYFGVTYDLNAFCDFCHSGAVQRAPFHMRTSPRWGTRHVCSLNWVPDEFFVRDTVWKAVFEPLGVACRPVLHYKRGHILDSVVQLTATTLPGPLLDLEQLSGSTCPKCGQTIYEEVGRGISGRAPSLSNLPPAGIHYTHSQEYFGGMSESGGMGHHLPFVSQDLYRAIVRHHIGPLHFIPVAEHSLSR